MFETGYEFIMWQTYRDRMREAEKNRLVRQARAGQKRDSRLLAWARAWLDRHLWALRTEWQAHLRSMVKEAATDSKTGGGLIL
jgi:hypothetical protein